MTKQNDIALQGALTEFLSERAGAEVRIDAFQRFTAGFSWATFGVEVSGEGAARLPGQSLILRLGPDEGLFAPYSSLEQYQVLFALENCAIPTPKVYWHSDDRSRFGAPFFVCERVAGNAPLPSEPAPPGDVVCRFRTEIGQQFVSALACLHNFNWQKSVVSAWGAGITAANAALIQVEICQQDYKKWSTQPVPVIIWALHWLRRNAPEARRLTLVHGDYRVGNFLCNGPKITAILDWESAHIGDPHEDLGWAVLPQFGGGTGMVCRMLPEANFFASYEQISGWSIDRAAVHYYEVLALLRLALINLIAGKRFELPGRRDIRMAALGTQLPSTLRQLQKIIEARS